MKALLCGLLVCISTLLAGCSGSGDEFVGEWAAITPPQYYLRSVAKKIEKNGSGFWITTNNVIMISKVKAYGLPNAPDKVESEKVPAIFKDGQLQSGTGNYVSVFVIDKSTGNLNGNGIEYKRTK